MGHKDTAFSREKQQNRRKNAEASKALQRYSVTAFFLEVFF